MIGTVKVLGITNLIKKIDSNDRKGMINTIKIKNSTNMTDNIYKVKMRKWTENLFGHEIITDNRNTIITKREQNTNKKQVLTAKSNKLLIKNIRIRKILKKIIRIR